MVAGDLTDSFGRRQAGANELRRQELEEGGGAASGAPPMAVGTRRRCGRGAQARDGRRRVHAGWHLHPGAWASTG